MTGAITKAINDLEEIIQRHFIHSAVRDRDTYIQADELLQELKAFKACVPEDLECDLKNSTTPMSSYNAYETERSVIDAAKHLLEGIAE